MERLTRTTIEDIEWCWSIDEEEKNVQFQLNRRAKARGIAPQIVEPQTIAAIYEFIDLQWYRELSAGADRDDCELESFA